MRFRFALSALLVASAACDQDPRPAGWDDVSDVALPCQIDDARCRTAIFQAVAKLRDQRTASLPPIRLITRAEYVEELKADVGGAKPDPRSTRFSIAMGLFNTLAKSQTLAEADADSSAARVLAYYDHRAQDITVISDNAGSAEDGSSTLAHELTHALQDQRENLTQLDRRYAVNWDAMVSVDALVEGEAMWVEQRFNALAAGLSEPPRAAIDDFFQGWIHGTLASVQGSDSPLVVAQQLLPYGFGGARVSGLWYDRGGNPAVEELFRAPGVTFARWVDGAVVSAPDRDVCPVPQSGPGGRPLELLDYFGIPGMLALYSGLGHGADELLPLASQWRADWFAIYAPEDASSEDVAALWHIKLSSAAQAAQLAEEARDQLGALTELEGAEVSLYVASTPDLLDALSSAVSCGARTQSRLVASGAPMSESLRSALFGARPGHGAGHAGGRLSLAPAHAR